MVRFPSIVTSFAVLAAIAPLAAPMSPSARVPSCRAGQHVVLTPPARGAYAGAFPFFSSATRNEDAVSAQRLAAFERLTGKPLAWATFSNHWLRGRIRFPRAAVETVWAHGSLPLVRMMPWSRQRQDAADPVFRMQDVADGRWDAALRAWADAARATRIPIMVDFGPEMNGRWFPWNGTWAGGLAGAHAYRDAFRHVVTLFRNRGARNVSFAFHVGTGDPAAAWNSIREYYPGNRYVDWVGASVYGADSVRDDWAPFAAKLADLYSTLRALAPGKPFAVFEWGVVEAPAHGDKARWIDNAFRALAGPRFPRIRAISWWHERWQDDDGTWEDTRVNSSAAALSAYRRGIASARYVSRPRFTCAAG